MMPRCPISTRGEPAPFVRRALARKTVLQAAAQASASFCRSHRRVSATKIGPSIRWLPPNATRTLCMNDKKRDKYVLSAGNKPPEGAAGKPQKVRQGAFPQQQAFRLALAETEENGRQIRYHAP